MADNPRNPQRDEHRSRALFFGQPPRRLLSRAIFAGVAIAAALQFQHLLRTYQLPFVRQVWSQPSTVWQRFPEATCCALNGGPARWDDLLRTANSEIPHSEPILILTPLTTPGVDVAQNLANYVLYPRRSTGRITREFDAAALSELAKTGVRYALLYRVKPESWAILKEHQLHSVDFGNGMFLLNLTSQSGR